MDDDIKNLVHEFHETLNSDFGNDNTKDIHEKCFAIVNKILQKCGFNEFDAILMLQRMHSMSYDIGYNNALNDKETQYFNKLFK